MAILQQRVVARSGGYRESPDWDQSSVRVLDHVTTQIIRRKGEPPVDVRRVLVEPNWTYLNSADYAFTYSGDWEFGVRAVRNKVCYAISGTAGASGSLAVRLREGDYSEHGETVLGGPGSEVPIVTIRMASGYCALGFIDPGAPTYPSCDGAPAAAFGDFDLDGTQDLVVAGTLMRSVGEQCSPSPDQSTPYLRYGGTLEPLGGRRVESLDISADGHADFILDGVPWITADGGPVESPDALSGAGTLQAALDADGDGTNDAIFATPEGVLLKILSPTGGVVRTVTLPDWVQAPALFHADDLDQDGLRDLVVDSAEGGGILWGDREYGYVVRRSIDGHGAAVVHGATHDRIATTDGILDLAAAMADPTVAPMVAPMPGPTAQGHVWSADFDGDGLYDLAMSDARFTDTPVATCGMDLTPGLVAEGEGTFCTLALGQADGTFRVVDTWEGFCTLDLGPLSEPGGTRLLSLGGYTHDYGFTGSGSATTLGGDCCMVEYAPHMAGSSISVSRLQSDGTREGATVDVYSNQPEEWPTWYWSDDTRTNRTTRVQLGDLTRDGVADLVWEAVQVGPVDGDVTPGEGFELCAASAVWGFTKRRLVVMDGLSVNVVDSTDDIGSEWLLRDMDGDGFPELVDVIPGYNGATPAGTTPDPGPSTLRIRATRPGLVGDPTFAVRVSQGRTTDPLLLPPAVAIELPRLRPGAQLMAEDFDDDGCVDVAIADKTLRPDREYFRGDPDTFGTLTIFRGTTPGGLTEATSVPLPGDTKAVVPADLDGDGDLDAAVEAVAGLLLLRNDGAAPP